MGEATLDLESWRAEVVGELLAAVGTDGAWGYRAGVASATEPTALAVLALSAAASEAEGVPAALDWLAARQRDDGYFAIRPNVPARSWVTPLAALAMHHHGRTALADAAASALLATPIFLFPNIRAPGQFGYNTLIPGWPWTSGDFPFVEPTSLAVNFLKQTGRGGEQRTRQGVELLRDRALDAGGWNYGEPEVLGGKLFPTVLPTALVLLALADEQDGATDAGLAFLLEQQGAISSLLSLGWATVALNVLGVLDDAWRADVMGLWTSLPAERRDPMSTALCLLGLTGVEDHPFAV